MSEKNADRLLALLLSTARLNLSSFDGTIAVVGNGPISEGDRAAIEAHRVVVRFNDANYIREGERTTLRVVRAPTSRDPKVFVAAPIWSVSPVESYVPSNAAFATPVFERQYGTRNWIDSTSVIFPSCAPCASCAQAGTFAGPSTGAVALSVLNELPEVSRVDVFGMNWNGPAKIHVDFANRTLVHDCCDKCVFNATESDYYGTGFTLFALLLVVFSGAIVLSCLAGTWVEATAPRPQKELLPLLSMKLNVEEDEDSDSKKEVEGDKEEDGV